MRPTTSTPFLRTGKTEAPNDIQSSTEHGGHVLPQQVDPHVNAQLARSFPRRPVHPAPFRPPRASVGERVAESVATTAATLRVLPNSAMRLAPALFAYSIARNDPNVRACWAIAGGCGLVGHIGLRGVEQVARYAQSGARWYAAVRSSRPVTVAGRAKELGTSEACLYEALDLVTMLGEEQGEIEMSEAELNALAKDLHHIATEQKMRLDPDLWRAASGHGDNASALIGHLLELARSRAEVASSLASSATN
ncbi:hypothetical protein PD885_02787 [Xanthomonas fragariae]|uniref:Uncharacterized protein n=2 Tax=Xanthomonas fragariae TaxID=48664 RepID=A0ABY1RRW7_9XANT|nr:hypothetical protein PD885_02787 [Xanthomonas fragariae]